MNIEDIETLEDLVMFAHLNSSRGVLVKLQTELSAESEGVHVIAHADGIDSKTLDLECSGNSLKPLVMTSAETVEGS